LRILPAASLKPSPSGGQRRPGDDWRRGQVVASWLGVLAVAIAFRLHGLHHNLLYDHLTYAQYAYDIVQGTFTLRDNYAFAHRLPVFVPMAPAYAVLGVSSLSTMLWPFLLSLVQVGLVIALGSRLFDRPTGLLAGLFLAMVPLDVIYSGIPGADGIMATFLTGAVALWLWGTDGPRAPRRLLLFLSGACFAAAGMTKMYAAVLGFFFLVDLLWRRPPRRCGLWALLGALAVAAPVMLLYRLDTGDALYPLTVQSQTFGERISRQDFAPLYYSRYLANPRSAIGLFGPLFMGAFLIGLWRPDRARRLLFLWILPLFLFLQFGSMGLHEFRPVNKELRYLSPLFAPLSLLAASVAVQVASWAGTGRWSRTLRVRPERVRGVLLGLLLAGLTLFSWYRVGQFRDERRRVARSYETVEAFLRRTPSLPIFFDHWRTGLAFSYYFEFEQGANFYHGAEDNRRIGQPGSFGRSRFGFLPWFRDPARIPRGFIVLDDEVLALARKAGSPPAPYLGVVVPAYCFKPPAGWTPVLRAGRLRVFLNPVPGDAAQHPAHAP
jgi:4-amino-4-deoxy-L-arabinose transferase-like glycosyltransferase